MIGSRTKEEAARAALMFALWEAENAAILVRAAGYGSETREAVADAVKALKAALALVEGRS